MSLKTKRFTHLWTYEELIANTPETNQTTELWDGEIIMPPAPSFQHQEVSRRLEEALREWVKKTEAGVVAHAPLDVVLAPRRVVQPDILFINNSRHNIITDVIRGAPDLVVEVVSPGSWRRDYVDKKALYEQFGVIEYWIVDPEAHMIEVLFLEKGVYHLLGRFGSGEMARSCLLKGFEVEVNDIVRSGY